MYDDPPLHPMQHFTTMHCVFHCEAKEHIALDAQPGTAIRGALYHALIDLFSPNDPIPGVPLDPVRALLAAENEENARGRDVPRAFSVEPPPAHTHVETGSRFQFGVSLFGTANVLAPYLFRALPEMGKRGIGKGRGRFELIRVNEFSPLDESNRIILHPHGAVDPRLTVTHRRVMEEVGMRNSEIVTVRFLSPMRLIENGALVRKPMLGPLLRRLIERAQSLVELYSPAGTPSVSRAAWKDEWQRIGTMGDQIDEAGALLDATQWVDIQSYSQARGRATPIGGIVGQVRWRVDSAAIMTWLLWGACLHIGKNVAKGDGYFSVE
ncbi:MAG: CRISPR system precrRNA processing endoribonuclease RAMP protein Cas6 [Chloroflexota bacterium]|nr:CRISPR system precrRNA processing endoribonuclease RAMP protein Cas6 [Chloroflexota bacterium]